MEVVMNGFAQIRPLLRLVLPLLCTLALIRPAHAAAESITMIWINAATAERYEVTAPVDTLVSAVKQQVMSDIGLSPLQSPLYAVEKVVVTTTLVRGTTDPSTGIPTPPTTITTEEYVLLNEASTLTELEIADGDTLRLRQIAAASGDDTTGDTTTDPADDSAGDTTDDAGPVTSGQNRDCNKRHHHRYVWEHNRKHSGKRRFG
jgi:hypothetical protein